jgi:phosphatidylglycerophosphate synthase
MKTLVSPQLWTSRRSSTEYWLVAASGLVLLGAALVGWRLSWLSASTATFCFLLLAALVARYSRSRSLRIADLVTLTRGLGVCFLAGLALQALAEGLTSTGVLTMIIVSALCLTLDGLDGKVARARGEATAFGARFDLETDAAMLAVLSLAVAALGIAGWWVLAIGAMRYGYVALSLVLPALRTQLPSRYSAKVVAVIQAVALIAALIFGLTHGQHWVPTIFLVVSLGLLCWSFSCDIILQLRRSL